MYNRLYRSRIDRVLGGVAAGLAEHLNIDKLLVRILFIALVLANGIGIILYLVLWVVIPEKEYIVYAEGERRTVEPGISRPGLNSNKTVGIILIILGGIFLLDDIFSRIDFFDLLPLALIGAGAVILYNSKRESASHGKD